MLSNEKSATIQPERARREMIQTDLLSVRDIVALPVESVRLCFDHFVEGGSSGSDSSSRYERGEEGECFSV